MPEDWEDKVTPELCHDICMQCPVPEALEVEICGYHDGKPVFAWVSLTSSPPPPHLIFLSQCLQSGFPGAFSTLAHIRHLRICTQFPEYDETGVSEPWRAARKECAVYLVSQMPTLQRVGFEYRKHTGTPAKVRPRTLPLVSRHSRIGKHSIRQVDLRRMEGCRGKHESLSDACRRSRSVPQHLR